MSYAVGKGRASRLASSCPKDFNFEFFVYSDEGSYPDWWNRKRVISCFRSLPDDTLWNVIVCILVLVGVIMGAIDLVFENENPVDIAINAIYMFHVLVMFFEYRRLEHIKQTLSKKLGLLLDVLSYLHYFTYFLTVKKGQVQYNIKLVCYYVRLHRPIRYLLALTDSNLKGSVVGTALKYFYMFTVAVVTFSFMWIEVYGGFGMSYNITILARRTNPENTPQGRKLMNLLQTRGGRFFLEFYCSYKLFLPIGLEYPATSDTYRMLYLLVMITGCLLVTGAAVASLALVISLYMRPEEAFRARFRLIMQDMVDTHVPPQLRQKVETFYRMYWHKQKAVSVTQLLPIFPPALPASIYTDIYFEAQQKSTILRDLSYMFLWEVAKCMETIHFIPGDSIISRNSSKSSIIYISYGDVEMVTAEDDDTAILRMTRGSIISPCGGAVAMACGKSLVGIRAATFCTAHVLKAADLWRIALKYGKHNGQAFIILSAFEEHFEKVKRHYRGRIIHPVKHKSSIMQFKRNLIALKAARDTKGELMLARSDFFLEIAGCYIMRNRADTSLTEESDEICLRPTFPCILQPQSSILVAWQLIVALLICVVCITHPYNLVFLKSVPLEFRFFDYVVTSVFVLDLLVHLSTGANVEEGVPITFTHTSSQQIKSPWFIVDVLATMPIFEFIGDGHFAGINKLFRLPKVFRVLKSLEEVNMYHSNVMRFLSYALLLFMVCWFVGALHQAHMCFIEHRCIVGNFSHAPHWIEKPLDTTTIEERLTFSMYWSLSIISFTTHHTTRLGHASVEYLIFMVAIMMCCAIIHIFIESMYSATIMVTSAMRDEFESCIENVTNFLIRNKMEPTLRKRFIQYLQLCWYTDMAYAITHGKRSIYYDLPPHVHHDIFARQRNKYILCVPLLQLLSTEELKVVSANARLFYTSPNEILLNTGDINNEIYVIKRGFCEVIDPDAEETVSLLGEKKYFGILECLMRIPAYYTVRAVTHVQVFAIPNKYLQTLIESPKIKDAIEFAKKQPEYARVQVRRDPFMDYEFPPPPSNRQRFPLPRKHIPDTAFMHPFTSLGFFSFLRYVFPRFTIRPDGKYIMRYEWFRGICAMASAMIYPSYTYLELQWPNLVYVARILDFMAYFDMVQRLLVGYFNEKGILVYHPSSTAAHYLKGAFVVDLFASLPLENLETHYENTQFLTDVGYVSVYTEREVTQFMMLNRIIQLYRLPSAMQSLTRYIPRRDFLLVIQAIPLFMVLINLVTCALVIESCNVLKQVNGTQGWKITPQKDKGGSWLELFKHTFRFNMTETPWNLHLATYFWVVYETTTTGMNYFGTTSLTQITVLIIGMFVGAMMTTYFAVMVISIRANVNKVLANYQENMKDIDIFMRREKLDQDLQREVISYFEYNWDKVGGLDYRNVLKLCDQITLRTDAILHIYGHTFSKCPILFHCDISLLRVMGRAVHSLYFQSDAVIIEKDDVIRDLYLIDYGSVEIRDIKENASTVTRLPKGSAFGNLDAEATYRIDGQVVATSEIHLLKINSLMFHTIILDFPTVKVLMKKYRPRNEYFITGSEGLATGPNVRTYSRVSMAFMTMGKHGPGVSQGGRIAMIYLIVVSLLCVYGDLYNAGFNDNNFLLIVGLYLLDVLFLLKIVVNTGLPLLLQEGSEQKQMAVAATKKYIRTELKYDILSMLPIETLCYINKANKGRLFSLLRLNRAFRVVTIYKCFQRHSRKLSINLVFTTVVAVSIWFSLFIHTTSCLWYLIGELEDYRQTNSSWRHIEETKFVKKCENMYLCSFYFVLATVTENSVEDIKPMTHLEVIFVALLQILSSLIYMIYVGEFSNIIQYQSFRSFGFYSQYLELQEFLKNNRVSKNLMELVKRYSLHLWQENRGLQVPHFLTSAPHCLRLKIMGAAYLHHLENSPIFKHCEPPFLRQLVGCLILYTYCADVFVAKEGEITDSMYLIHRGEVQEVDEDMEECTTGPTFGPGDIFGTSQGLVHDAQFTFSYRTTMVSQVLTLHLDTWGYLLKHFPKSRYAIYRNIPGHPYSRPPPAQKPVVLVPESTGKRDTFFKPPPGPQLDDAGTTDAEPTEADSQWPMRDRRRRSTITRLPYQPAEEQISDIDLTQQETWSIESLPNLEDLGKPQRLAPQIQKKKTFLQKMSESAKKMAKRTQTEVSEDYEEGMSAQEMMKFAGGVDALPVEELEEPVMQKDKIQTQEIKDQQTTTRKSYGFKLPVDEEATSSQKTDPRSVRLHAEDTEDDADKTSFYEKRAARLSFLPGLVQKKDNEAEAGTSQTPTQSGLPESTSETKEGESSFNERRAPRRSILSGATPKAHKRLAREDDDNTRSKRVSTLSFLSTEEEAPPSTSKETQEIILPKFLQKGEEGSVTKQKQEGYQKEAVQIPGQSEFKKSAMDSTEPLDHQTNAKKDPYKEPPRLILPKFLQKDDDTMTEERQNDPKATVEISKELSQKDETTMTEEKADHLQKDAVVQVTKEEKEEQKDAIIQVTEEKFVELPKDKSGEQGTAKGKFDEKRETVVLLSGAKTEDYEDESNVDVTKDTKKGDLRDTPLVSPKLTQEEDKMPRKKDVVHSEDTLERQEKTVLDIIGEELKDQKPTDIKITEKAQEDVDKEKYVDDIDEEVEGLILLKAPSERASKTTIDELSMTSTLLSHQHAMLNVIEQTSDDNVTLVPGPSSSQTSPGAPGISGRKTDPKKEPEEEPRRE